MGAGALQGQVAVITGAGSGLGAAFARRLAADGAHVVVNDLDVAAAEQIAHEIGGTAAPFDVTDSAAFDQAIDRVVSAHGRLDIMINNAGIAPPFEREQFEATIANEMLRMEGRIDEMQPLRLLSSMTDREWDRMIRVHLDGTFFGMRAALRHMESARSGAIVNISSVLGLRPAAGAPSYSAAKAAIIGLTRATALEVAHLGIRINAVCPGWVDTPLLADHDASVRALITTRIPLGRMATADELAELVRFVVGPEASYSTGDVYPVSGGYA
ncbi:MAG: SDR family oxidoreductase [Nocardiopsis sp. BM-2018]|nr:MAG: SDR family oxidoreductase [Nocardiopsis sp. BM-2018]